MDKLVVMGQGYVGLSLSVAAASSGRYFVVAFESDERRAELLASGISYVEGIDDSTLRELLSSGKLTVATDATTLADFDFALVAVQTPVTDGAPDLRHVVVACEILGTALTPGATVIVESTTQPGTTDLVVRRTLEARSGLKCGSDFYLGYSPERINPGDSWWTVKNIPKIVSGYGDESLREVARFYRTFVDEVVQASRPVEAEMAKLLENTFRQVNIALINELAIAANELDIDIREVIRLASTKPFGYMPFQPGAGAGGHCIPVDPAYLASYVRRNSAVTLPLVELAQTVNDRMPLYVMERARLLLRSEGLDLVRASVLVVGLAYKANTSDTRGSAGIALAKNLLAAGASVQFSDPYISTLPEMGIVRVDFNEVERRFDLAVIVVNHANEQLDRVKATSSHVLDCCGSVDGPHVVQL